MTLFTLLTMSPLTTSEDSVSWSISIPSNWLDGFSNESDDVKAYLVWLQTMRHQFMNDINILNLKKDTQTISLK